MFRVQYRWTASVDRRSGRWETGSVCCVPETVESTPRGCHGKHLTLSIPPAPSLYLSLVSLLLPTSSLPHFLLAPTSLSVYSMSICKNGTSISLNPFISDSTDFARLPFLGRPLRTPFSVNRDISLAHLHNHAHTLAIPHMFMHMPTRTYDISTLCARAGGVQDHVHQPPVRQGHNPTPVYR